MKKRLGGLFAALSLYSVIPVPQIEWSSGGIRYTLCFFPIVGLVIGALELLWFRLCLHTIPLPVFGAAVATLIPILVSGGIHMDGFIDTSDAIACHGTREKKIEVLHDPHTGAFGVLACAGYLLLSFALWYHLLEEPRLLFLAAAGFPASRCLSAISVARIPPAQQSNLVFLFASAADRRAVTVSSALVLAGLLFCVLQAFPGPGLLAAVVCAGYFFFHRRFCLHGFGGNTGDLAGFLLQNLELMILMIAAVGGRLTTGG